MKGAIESFVLALIVAIIVLAFLFIVVLKTIPFISKGIDSIILGIKKPICCNMLGCKPATQQITTNPTGGVICSTLCWGVCD